MRTIENCTIEIDEERGVIYVHAPTHTAIRINTLSPLADPIYRHHTKAALKRDQLDITIVTGSVSGSDLLVKTGG